MAAIRASAVSCQVDVASWDTPVFPEKVRAEFAQSPPREYARRDALTSHEVRDYWAAQEKFVSSSRGLLTMRPPNGTT